MINTGGNTQGNIHESGNSNSGFKLKNQSMSNNSLNSSNNNGLKFKHKLDQSASSSGSSIGHIAKKLRLDKAGVGKTAEGSSDGITEEAVRRYLMRKPMTAKDLLQKFKKSKTGQQSDNRVAIIADILKKLNPVKQTINDKLYFSLKSI